MHSNCSKNKLSTALTRNESVMILNQQPGKIKIYNRKGAVQDGSFPSHYKKENYWTSFVLCIVFFFSCYVVFVFNCFFFDGVL